MKINKDWVGDKTSVFKTLGASSHSDEDREKDDFYATDPLAGKYLLEMEELSDVIIDNSYGAGHLMKFLSESGKKIIGYDIESRFDNDLALDFHKEDWLSVREIDSNADIVFNPPYKYAKEFVEHSIKLAGKGRKICAFLKVQFLEGKSRKEFFRKYPPKRVWISSSRILCVKNGQFKKGDSSAVAYAWFIWEKGYKGETILKWFN